MALPNLQEPLGLNLSSPSALPLGEQSAGLIGTLTLILHAAASWFTPAWSHAHPQSPLQPHSYGGLVYPRQKGPGYDYTSFPPNQTYRAEAVIEQFRFAWNGYYAYAFPHDDLLPVTNSFSDSRNGWGLLMVDALDTAIIMEQQDIVDTILDFIPTIDFTKNNSSTPVTTSLFETNIRYLGGLLSAYDLLKEPFDHMVGSRSRNVEALLRQAQTVADTLKFCFDTPTGIPVNLVHVDNQTFASSAELSDGTHVAGLAELGTLVLEWQRLSDLTGNPEYGYLAQRAEAYWFNATEIWPGLTGGLFSVENGTVIDDYGGWTSGNDSAYEYLNYSARWTAAADSTIAYLVRQPSSRPDLSMAGSFRGTHVEDYSEQLACFIGGNFILGSTALGEPKYLEYGLLFSEFCANGYRHAASGIGPILYSWDPALLETEAFANQSDLYSRAGWFIPDNNAFFNGQAPEAVESWYHAYQATGDSYWRDVAWAYTVAQNVTERAGGAGFASVHNVLQPDGNGTQDFMASYMLAEVLKYQYLIQAPPEKKGVWDVLAGPDQKNYFVYNTEAHPLRVAARNPV